MKILYAIQGTGNGHISRAKEIIPALESRVQVHILLSGTQSDIELPFPVKYRFKGISFVFGKKGGIDYWKTLRTNNIFRIIKEIKKCRVKQYDLVINDFEPISAWACRLNRKISCVSLSHQSALLSPKTPKPKKKSIIGDFILKYYAPVTIKYGFHFKSYDNKIFPAVIRKDIRKQSVKNKNFYVVYLPSYSDERIIKILSKIKRVKWKVYSKQAKRTYYVKNIKVKPIGDLSFERNLAWSKGIICGAGFETPAEALFLRKKLLVIPMKGQREQYYNAASLKELGVKVLKQLNEKKVGKIKKWIDSEDLVEVNFPDSTQFIIDEIITNHIIATELSEKLLQNI